MEGRKEEGGRKDAFVGSVGSLPRIRLKNEFILDRRGRIGGWTALVRLSSLSRLLGQFRGRQSLVDTCWLLAFDGLSSNAAGVGVLVQLRGWWPKGETHRSP